MKKFLLSLFAFAATTVAAFAQTNLVQNGGFEEWNGNTPKYWQSASKASSATLAPSDDAHSGSYAVKVSGSTSGNKRLAYNEITLKAGTYNVKFYAKAATDEGGSIRPGYVPVDANDKADNNGYVYGNYVNDLTATSWTEVTYSFTLDNETRLALVAMNPKKPGKDVLVDDYELTTADGGLVEGGTTEPTEPTEPTTSALPYKQAFDNGEGDFTIEDKELGGLSYVWKADTKYSCMKASAFVNSAHATESWLVSPEIDMTGYEDCTLYFEHAAKFFGSSEDLTKYCQVVVRVPGESDWEEVSYEGLPSGNDWTFVTANGSLKAYDGKKIQLAFRYTSTEEVAGSWEIKNLVVNGTKSTGINQAVDGTAQKFVIYSLDGRRLSAPEKGINIINGKKVLVK